MGLSVALIEPQIPPNTGNIVRLCAATDTPLHLIGEPGFRLDDPSLIRAGLHYWHDVDIWPHPLWSDFRSAICRERCLYFSSHGARSYLDAPFRDNAVLVFGNETGGLPVAVRDKYPDCTFRIPMSGSVRCLNLATAVGIVLYEGIRKLNIRLDQPIDQTG
ncbi:MAG: tRNA (cytidine(34)-2'-O)-methyltransferase [Gemmatimonadales bacterium]